MERWPITNFVIIAFTSFFFFYQWGLDEETFESLVHCNGSFLGWFGHLILHGNFEHIFGNMIFLWTFGNAICAKFGNLRYIGLYLLFGMSSAFFHAVFDGDPAIGASGAINGVIGAFLFLYPVNTISVFFWFFGPRFFTVSSMWMILLWLAFDIYGVFLGHGSTAYIAHLGGFIAGAATGWLGLKLKWIEMDVDELSLLQYIKNRGSLRTESRETTETLSERDDGGYEPPEVYEPEKIKKYQVRCPKCKVKITSKKDLDGQSVTCPKCKSEFRIGRMQVLEI